MRALRRGLTGWLLLALLWAPTLGQLHRHVHVRQGPALQRVAFTEARLVDAGAQAVASQSVNAESGGALPHWIGALFSSHGQAGDCLLFDQCNVADAPASALPALPAPLPVFLLQIFVGEVRAYWVARYDVRGPPPVR